MTQLTKLNISRNNLTNLPAEFYRMRELKQLNLAYNKLSDVNVDISDLVMLEELVGIKAFATLAKHEYDTIY